MPRVASWGSVKPGNAADYDDWVSETVSASGRRMHGLDGDILVWNPVTRRRHELSSMGIRVDARTLRLQLEMSGQLDLLDRPYHQAIMHDRIPLSIGGGIGQSRTLMLLLRKAHLGGGERERLAQGPQGDLGPQEHPRAGLVAPVRFFATD